MANALAKIILLLTLLCWSATGVRTKSIALTNRRPLSNLDAVADDSGICQLMVEPQNYDCEEHTATTQDGYILSLQIITVGHSGGTTGDRPPAMLQQGLRMDGITWLLLPVDKSLAFLLADNNFDVWIANTRGTKYSRGHTSLSPDEAVSSDLPAVFNYVYNQTGERLHYVGHSQGTLMAPAALSKEQLLDMLRSAVLLNPIAYLSQMTSPLARRAAEKFIAEALYRVGMYEIDLRGAEVVKILRDICHTPGVDCTPLLTSFTGPNCCLNSTALDVFLDHKLQPTLTKNLIHLAQMVGDGKISMYDYGNEGQNMEHYGQAMPSLYNLPSIPNDVPLFLSYGRADALSDVRDVKLLLESLKDHDRDKLVTQYREDYAHGDFIMGDNAREVVYDPLMAFLRLQ